MRSSVRRVFTSLLAILITIIMGVIVNIISFSYEKKGLLVSNEHENVIKECVIKSENIDITLEKIGGLSNTKEHVRRNILLPLKYPNLFFKDSKNIIRPNKGILLHGPPGTGKTLLVKAISKESNVPVINMTASTLESKWFGESNKLIQALFKYASSIQPCIIFFDEIDGIGRTRSTFDQSCVSTFKTELLQQMDGINTSSNDAVIVIACTNDLKNLDPALKRRLPTHFEVNLPDFRERYEILSIITENEKIDSTTLIRVATATDGFSGSDLASLYRQVSSYRTSKDITMENISKLAVNAKTSEDLISKLSPLTLQHWQHVMNSTEEYDNAKENDNTGNHDEEKDDNLEEND